MQLVVDDVESVAPVVLHPPPMTDDEFFDFCQLYPNFRVERTAEGEILIMPPGGLETSFRNCDLTAQLANWAEEDGRGKSFGSDAEFILPTGAARSPSTSWVSNEKLAALSAAEKRKFPRVCPEFVVELLSPSDRLPAARAKMDEWIANGVQLGWLLDPDRRTAIVYRPARAPETLLNPAQLEGEGPVAGFVLELADIWNRL